MQGKMPGTQPVQILDEPDLLIEPQSGVSQVVVQVDRKTCREAEWLAMRLEAIPYVRVEGGPMSGTGFFDNYVTMDYTSGLTLTYPATKWVSL